MLVRFCPERQREPPEQRGPNASLGLTSRGGATLARSLRPLKELIYINGQKFITLRNIICCCSAIATDQIPKALCVGRLQ